VSKNKVMSKNLQDSVVTQTMLSGLTVYIIQLQISYSVYLPKIMKIGRE